MKRRNFIKASAAGVSALWGLQDLEKQVAAQLHQFRSDLGSASNPTEYWRRVQGCFDLQADIIHLNCGSIGACPRMVTSALANYASAIEKDPFRNFWGDGLCENLESVRETAARFLNATAEEILVTRNTTEGMNLIAGGLDLNPGDEVLTTNHEHAGGMVCWQHLAKRFGIKVVCIKIPKQLDESRTLIDLIQENTNERTRVFSFCHVDTITGYRMPVAEIALLAKQRDIFFVCDGAQAPGMLAVDVKQLGVDAYASSSHKWMLAPKGSGLLYIAKQKQSQVQSMALSAGYQIYSASSGTRDIAKILAHGVAMEFQNSIGKEKIEQRVRELNRFLENQLGKIKPLSRLTPQGDAASTGIVTYTIAKDAGDSHEIAKRLMETNRVYLKAAPVTYAFVSDSIEPPENYNALRFSTHIFNSEEEIERAVSLLAELVERSYNRGM